ncbi:hypothetical protein VTK56DRAFT_2511 [Thermocarpiscus australiensis]
MRYDDWDVILFPSGRDSRIPFKEFKVACHVVRDHEVPAYHGPYGLPVMTCFVPSLPAGTPFQISIHCWRQPEISKFTSSWQRNEHVKFEARIMLDGRLVASTILDREVNGPHLVTSTFEFTKNGELERLRFPHFRRELLYQNHWNPGDDIGRIKIIITEGFPRDSLSVPIERVKNVVAFSFQHAPLEILESNGIAWPNPSMWRRPPAMPVPTYHPADGAESHTHSPRRKSVLSRNARSQGFPAPASANGIFHTQASVGLVSNQPFQMPYLGVSNKESGPPLSYPDPFAESAAYLEWVTSMTSTQSTDSIGARTFWPTNTHNASRQTNSDTTMSDYIPSHASDPMQLSGGSLEDDPMCLKVPTNTPTAGTSDDLQGAQYQLPTHVPTLHPEFAASLTQSLLSQPPPLPILAHNLSLPSSEVKSRKENRHASLSHANAPPMPSTLSLEGIETRKFSHPIFGTDSFDSAISVPTSSVPSDNEENKSPSQPAALSTGSRNPSGGEFGSNITNLSSNVGSSSTAGNVAGPAESSLTSNPNGVAGLGGGNGNGNNNTVATQKRTRTFTPASAKAIDEEDEPRRASPHVRIVGFGAGDVAGDVSQ